MLRVIVSGSRWATPEQHAGYQPQVHEIEVTRHG